MAIYNFCSINIDHFYRMKALPKPGETLAAQSYSFGLGGKGANQSVAAARAGAQVIHIGAVGQSDDWVLDRLKGFGVDVRHIQRRDGPSGQAIINIDDAGENTIVLLSAANTSHAESEVEAALSSAGSGDFLLLQNETNQTAFAAELAQSKGMSVVYSAAPFSVTAVRDVLPHVSILAMNEVEAAQLCAAFDTDLEHLPVAEVIVTLGAKGAQWRSNESGATVEVAAPKVPTVDTTAAGDTFIGYVTAGLARGMDISEALEWGTSAAALKVTRSGTADAIPTAAEVREFLNQ